MSEPAFIEQKEKKIKCIVTRGQAHSRRSGSEKKLLSRGAKTTTTQSGRSHFRGDAARIQINMTAGLHQKKAHESSDGENWGHQKAACGRAGVGKPARAREKVQNKRERWGRIERMGDR